MPWEVRPVSEIRLAFVHQVLSLHTPVATACRTAEVVGGDILRRAIRLLLASRRRQPDNGGTLWFAASLMLVVSIHLLRFRAERSARSSLFR
jgi:hypothetical protein